MYFRGIAFARGVTRRPWGKFSFTEYAHWMWHQKYDKYGSLVKTQKCKQNFLRMERRRTLWWKHSSAHSCAGVLSVFFSAGVFAAVSQFENDAIVFVLSPLTNSHVASVNPEFGATMARRLNQSRVSAMPQSNLIAIKFGTAEARRLNWAFSVFMSHFSRI